MTNVALYRLINGQLKDVSDFDIFSENQINCIGLDFIISYINKDKIINNQYNPENDIKTCIEKRTIQLKEYASCILKGDFSIFSSLEPIIKDYFRDLYKKTDPDYFNKMNV